MDYPNKIDLIMKTLGVNQAGLAAKLGVSKGIISEFASGAREPSKDFLLGISKLGISLDWFLTGNGEIFLKSSTVEDLKNDAVTDFKSTTVVDLKNVTTENLPAEGPASDQALRTVPKDFPARRGFQVLNARQLRQPRNLELYKYRKGKGVPVPTSLSTVDPEAVAFVPIYNQRAAAGPGQDATQLEETEGLVPIVFDLFGLHRPESCGIVQVVGDSMSDISLFNGDWCLFDRMDIQGDGIFVIAMYGEMRVKRLQYRLSDRKIIIASENKKRYPEAEIVSSEIASSGQLLIYGRVFAWFHKHPY